MTRAPRPFVLPTDDDEAGARGAGRVARSRVLIDLGARAHKSSGDAIRRSGLLLAASSDLLDRAIAERRFRRADWLPPST